VAGSRIVIVDDDRPFLEVLTDMLNGRGYYVCPASGPREPLNIIQNHALKSGCIASNGAEQGCSPASVISGVVGQGECSL
jgi:CheY-like chemotaxis protein